MMLGLLYFFLMQPQRHWKTGRGRCVRSAGTNKVSVSMLHVTSSYHDHDLRATHTLWVIFTARPASDHNDNDKRLSIAKLGPVAGPRHSLRSPSYRESWLNLGHTADSERRYNSIRATLHSISTYSVLVSLSIRYSTPVNIAPCPITVTPVYMYM